MVKAVVAPKHDISISKTFTMCRECSDRLVQSLRDSFQKQVRISDL